MNNLLIKRIYLTITQENHGSTCGMKCSRKHTDKLYPHFKKWSSQSTKKVNEEYRNMVIILLQRIERTYYRRLFIDNRIMTKRWSIIKEVMNTKKKRFPSRKFVISGNTVPDNITNLNISINNM